MEFTGKVISLIFVFLGLYTCILASEAETTQQVEEILSFSCIFWLPAILFYVLGATNKESENESK